MSSPLPCLGGLDGHDACHAYPADGKRLCRRKVELDAGMRTEEWVADGRCEELVVRAAGWEVPDA